ncbi:phosphatidylinositol transfer protein PDR16-like [Teratosphaeria destructans]|uniref:Phosphatidylinositol transfer protein PDR16-like n=1 Tax=Teratosphaeria destructans TaxID=418781 RepID=A0A9W7W385_9PEZI|nr:phosphatidylinositol transfer protein PDR16-like [Teratosphaeria destructans]
MSDADAAPAANGTLSDSSTTTTTTTQSSRADSSTTEAGVPAHHEPDWHPPKDGPLKTPIPSPSKACRTPPPRTLTPDEETKYATVLAAVSQWTALPASAAKGAPSAPIQDHERMWLTRDCLLRYLRATKWKTADALKRLQATITWRREYGADTFTADYISPENETGKQLVLGYDADARPCLYLNPAAQNTKMSDRQIHHLCYMLDRTIDLMPPGQESACLLINFKGAATGNVPSSAQARAVLNILQGHSPERLGKALISELPWYVSTFFKLISPFIDPVTREKMKFNEDLKKYIPAQQLWKKYGGELDFVYEHETYWPALHDECRRRREAYRARWERAGKRVGEYEAYLRGGDHPSLQQMLDQANGGVDGELADAAGKKLNV